jgi:hypothetical protein
MRDEGTVSARARRSGLCAALAAALVGSTAGAHGLDADRVEVVLRGDVVEAVATPRAGFVRDADADADGDGRLSLPEVNARRDEIRRALVDALRITDGDGRAGSLERSDVSVPHGHDGDDARGGTFLRVTVVLRWAAAPRAVRVRCAFVGERPVTVYATRAEAATPGVLTLVGDPELVQLASPDATVTLLRRADVPSPTTAPPAPASRPPAPAAPGAVAWVALAAALGAALLAARRRTLRLENLRPHPGEAR